MDKEAVAPETRMSLSEIMTILVMYHLSGYKTLKRYYTKYAMIHQRKYFPDLINYNRFAEIMKNICDIEHFGHRSVTNFLVNPVSALTAYSVLIPCKRTFYAHLTGFFKLTFTKLF